MPIPPDDQEERQTHKRKPDGGAREGHVDAHGAALAIQRKQHDAGDDRGQREGKVDHGVDDPLAAEFVTHEHPCDERPEDGVDERDDQRRNQRQLDRRDGLLARDLAPEGVHAAARRLGHERGDRREDERGEIDP